MEMQKLKDMQATLMSERGKLFDLQAGCEGNIRNGMIANARCRHLMNNVMRFDTL